MRCRNGVIPRSNIAFILRIRDKLVPVSSIYRRFESGAAIRRIDVETDLVKHACTRSATRGSSHWPRFAPRERRGPGFSRGGWYNYGTRFTRPRDEIKITMARSAAVESLCSVLRLILSRFSIDESIEDRLLSRASDTRYWISQQLILRRKNLSESSPLGRVGRELNRELAD